MKKYTPHLILTALIVAVLFFASCEKQDDEYVQLHRESAAGNGTAIDTTSN